MATPDFRTLSRENRCPIEPLTAADINCGSFQRIADAVEKMSGNYAAIINDRNLYKRWYEEGQVERDEMRKSAAALRGVITRQGNEIERLKAELARAKQPPAQAD